MSAIMPGQVWELRFPGHHPLRYTVDYTYRRPGSKDVERVHFVDDSLDSTADHLLASPDWRLVDEMSAEPV